MPAPPSFGTANLDIHDLVDLCVQVGDQDRPEGDARPRHDSHDVRDAVAKHLGDQQADAIMGSVLKHDLRRVRVSRIWRAKRKTMTKAQLAEIVRRTSREMLRRIDQMSLTERQGLLDSLAKRSADDPARFMKYAKANTVVHLAAAERNISRDPRFIDAVHKYEEHWEELEPGACAPTATDRGFRSRAADGDRAGSCDEPGRRASGIDHRKTDLLYREKLDALRAEAKQIVKRFVRANAVEQIVLGANARRQVCGREIDSLDPRGLRRLFDQAKSEAAARVVKIAVQPLMKQLSKHQWELSDDPPRGGMPLLEAIHNELGDDDQLCQHGRFLYQCSSRPNPAPRAQRRWDNPRPFWFWKRAAEARRAKESIQDLLVHYFIANLANQHAPAGLARTLMAPWMNSSRALSKADLSEIIARAKKWVEIQNATTVALQHCGQLDLERVQDFDALPRELWASFASFCGVWGMQFVWDQFEFLYDFEQSLRELDSRSSRENERRREERASGARAKAAHLLALYRFSHRLQELLQQFIDRTESDASARKRLAEAVAEERAEHAPELVEAYRQYYNRVIAPNKAFLERQRGRELRLAQMSNPHAEARGAASAVPGGSA